jgi:hypothetical protein
MRLVDAATMPPYVCAATGINHGRFVDTERDITGVEQRVYVSEEAVKEYGELFGMITGGQHRLVVKGLEERLGELEAHVAMLEQENATLKAFKGSVDTIVSEGFVQRKKPGRPVKETA